MPKILYSFHIRKKTSRRKKKKQWTTHKFYNQHVDFTRDASLSFLKCNKIENCMNVCDKGVQFDALQSHINVFFYFSLILWTALVTYNLMPIVIIQLLICKHYNMFSTFYFLPQFTMESFKRQFSLAKIFYKIIMLNIWPLWKCPQFWYITFGGSYLIFVESFSVRTNRMAILILGC